MKKSKAESQIDLRISKAYAQSCSNIGIDLMDIPKIFQHGRKLVAEGANDAMLAIGLKEFVEELKKHEGN